jgi:hypothetical protein
MPAVSPGGRAARRASGILEDTADRCRAALHVRDKLAGYVARTVAGICDRLDLSICEIA